VGKALLAVGAVFGVLFVLCAAFSTLVRSPSNASSSGATEKGDSSFRQKQSLMAETPSSAQTRLDSVSRNITTSEPASFFPTEVTSTRSGLDVDLLAFLGRPIEEVRAGLGPPKDSQLEPFKAQIAAGMTTWQNIYEQAGYEFVVSYDVATRKVLDFTVIGAPEELTSALGLSSDPTTYQVVTILPTTDRGISGVRIELRHTPEAVPTTRANQNPSSPIVVDPPLPTLAPDDKAGAVLHTRRWSSHDGRFKTEARFGGMVGSTVTLHKSDGTTVKVQLDQLSDADKSWIRSRRK
jgi:hypothetical protein